MTKTEVCYICGVLDWKNILLPIRTLEGAKYVHQTCIDMAIEYEKSRRRNQ